MKSLLAIPIILGLSASSWTAPFSFDDVQRIQARISAANHFAPFHVQVKSGVYYWCSVACAIGGRNILVSEEFLSTAKNEEELAFTIAHEMGHLLHSGETEMDADTFGLAYVNKAGYNGCKGAQILKTFRGDAQHPVGAIRYKHTRCP